MVFVIFIYLLCFSFMCRVCRDTMSRYLYGDMKTRACMQLEVVYGWHPFMGMYALVLSVIVDVVFLLKDFFIGTRELAHA